jgi:hypothetical protein
MTTLEHFQKWYEENMCGASNAKHLFIYLFFDSTWMPSKKVSLNFFKKRGR